MFATLRRAFVDARTFKHLYKDLSDFELDDVFRVFGVEFRVAL